MHRCGLDLLLQGLVKADTLHHYHIQIEFRKDEVRAKPDAQSFLCSVICSMNTGSFEYLGSIFYACYRM